jgi:hypothetical protein
MRYLTCAFRIPWKVHDRFTSMVPLVQDKAAVLSDVRSIIAEQLGADLDTVSFGHVMGFGKQRDSA